MTTEQIGLLVSMAVNCIALYGAFRKTRTEADRADVATETERAQLADAVEATAIARWREYAVEQEAARGRDRAHLEGVIDQMRHELAASREEGGKCRERSARQEERIENLTNDVKELRAALKRAGVKPGTGDHDPLKM